MVQAVKVGAADHRNVVSGKSIVEAEEVRLNAFLGHAVQRGLQQLLRRGAPRGNARSGTRFELLVRRHVRPASQNVQNTVQLRPLAELIGRRFLKGSHKMRLPRGGLYLADRLWVVQPNVHPIDNRRVGPIGEAGAEGAGGGKKGPQELQHVEAVLRGARFGLGGGREEDDGGEEAVLEPLPQRHHWRVRR